MKKLLLAAAAAISLLAPPALADNLPWVNSAHYQCSAVCASLTATAAPVGGAQSLFTWEVQADSTLYGSNWYILIFDSKTLPANGSVTPAKCYLVQSGAANAQAGATLGSFGEYFPNGVTIAVSTTGCFTLTTSTHAAFIGLDWQP